METQKNEKLFEAIINSEVFYEEDDDHAFGDAYTSMVLPITALVLSILALLGEIVVIITPSQWNASGTLWVFLLSSLLFIAPMWTISMLIVLMEKKEHLKKTQLVSIARILNIIAIVVFPVSLPNG